MRHVLADKLVVVPDITQVSRAIEMGGGNGLRLDVIIEKVSGEIFATIQVGNDLGDWNDAGTTSTTSPGSISLDVAGIASRYVRVAYFLDGVTNAILSVELETKRL